MKMTSIYVVGILLTLLSATVDCARDRPHARHLASMPGDLTSNAGGGGLSGQRCASVVPYCATCTPGFKACANCTSGRSLCNSNMACLDLQNDPQNCGTCGNACPTQADNGAWSCALGVCRLTCNTGYHPDAGVCKPDCVQATYTLQFSNTNNNIYTCGCSEPPHAFLATSTFQDTLSAGYIVKSVSLALHGYNCQWDQGAPQLNGNNLGDLTGGTECTCCTGVYPPASLTYALATGIPFYNVGGSNSITFNGFYPIPSYPVQVTVSACIR